MYQVPLSGTSGVPVDLTEWVAVLAGMKLLRSKPGGAATEQAVAYEQREMDINNQINDVLSGSRTLDCVIKSAGGGYTGTAPWVVV